MTRPYWAEATTNSVRDTFNRLNKREIERVNGQIGDPSSRFSALEAFRPQNATRNRYTNVFPWDFTRVKLPVISGSSDYINASYTTITEEFKYIASQGPLYNTIDQFWSMCFHEADKNGEDGIAIVMLTPLVESGIAKCVKYWPDSVEKQWDLSDKVMSNGINLDGLKIENIDEVTTSVYTLTRLRVTANSKSKLVFHYYYHQWDDSRIPQDPDSLIQLSNSLRVLQKESNISTPIIHCSAGVGRTGTFIMMDFLHHNRDLLLSSIKKDPIIEVFEKLRDDRMMMVQTTSQFVFIYDYFKRLLDVQ